MRIDKSRGFTDKVQITKEEQQKKKMKFLSYTPSNSDETRTPNWRPNLRTMQNKEQ